MMRRDTERPNNDLLTRAFRDFDQAATVLQQSYDALTTRLQQMDLELAQTNASLREHLRETEEMQAHVTAVLESLDTGVIVADSQDVVVRCNHSAEHLLGCRRMNCGAAGRLKCWQRFERITRYPWCFHQA